MYRTIQKTVFVAALCALVWSTTLRGQSSGTNPRPASANQRSSIRTADGRPDLQGLWSFATITPLERPKQFEGKAFLTPAEAAELEKRAETASSEEEGPAKATDGATVKPTGGSNLYNEIFWDRGTKVVKTMRTSMIVDPPDGKIPALTPEGQKRLAAFNAGGFDKPQADSYTDRSLWERCITHNSIPRLSSGYNNNVQIVQNPGYVIILYEQIHEPRIVPTDGRPHLPAGVRQWLGDSRGHWEGDTLVIDTTNFTDRTNFRGSGANLHLIERLRRLDADTLEYRFTVEDPTTWVRPWTVEVPWTKTAGPMIEYACHEGNYGLADILSAARTADVEQGGANK